MRDFSSFSTIELVAMVGAILVLIGLIWYLRRIERRDMPKSVRKSSWGETELIKVEEDGEIFAVANPQFRGKRTLPADYRAPFR